VWKIGYYLVAVAELTRSYGMRGWNGELAKVIQYVITCGSLDSPHIRSTASLLAKIQNDFVSARRTQSTWHPNSVTRRNPLNRRLTDWQKTVEQSCELLDVGSPPRTYSHGPRADLTSGQITHHHPTSHSAGVRSIGSGSDSIM
jgi:hypothetical protein